MEDRHISQLIQNLVERFEHFGPSQFNLKDELAQLEHPVTRKPIDPETLEKIDKGFLERIKFKKSHDGAILIPVSMVFDPKIHEEWYDEWIAENNNLSGSYYWKRLEDFLSRELTQKYGPESAGRIVRSIDEATASIIQKVANPARNTFSYKGLVVGYVQSGKTANFTALIAKAADAGYKLIIVLAGIHNVLRRQTQIRLDKELTGMNDLGIDTLFISEPSDVKRWNRLTTARNKRRKTRKGEIKIKDIGEFDTVNVDPFDSLCNRSTPTLAIVKKNVKILDKLIEYISQSTAANRSKVPLLIIDDEADQASIDGNANDPDADRTSTNNAIRRLLTFFSKKVYIGYTATPFANVLIDMTTDDDDVEDDLYPRNFIVSLPQPEGYFGTSLIFQGNLADRFVKEVPDEANTLIRQGIMTSNLSDSIDRFIICCSIRNLRGDSMKPMSMLVHISHRIIDMSVIREIIQDYIDAVKGRYNNKSHEEKLKNQFSPIWEELKTDAQTINHELKLKNFLPPFESIWKEIKNVFNKLRVMELNSESDDILDYTTSEEMKVIAVGGNQLSRGLTLDGLMTSYYLRASNQYDTLLQMGRWFGYRKDYEDLTRIHTTENIWDLFEHLALVEQELRSEIYRYEEEAKTPAQLAIAIRDHRNLTVTAANKMGAAKLRQASYSDSLNQTIWFQLDKPEILRSNYNLGESFVRKINKEVGFTNIGGRGVYLANKKLDGQVVLRDFLNRYTFIEKESTGGPGLDAESLLSYIFRRQEDRKSELNEWSIAVVGNVNPNAPDDPVSYGGLPLNRIQRSRKYTERGYNIGVLTEPDHLRIDLRPDQDRDAQNPLLLLYLIWKESKAGNFKADNELRYDQRIDLYRFVNTEKIDLLGLAIILPASQHEPNNYIGQ